MKEGNEALLEQKIQETLLQLDTLTPGEPGYSQLSERLDKLYRLQMDEKKALEEGNAKKAELKQQKTSFWIRLALDGAIALGTAGIYILCTRWGYRFEEHGTITSQTFKRVQNEGRLKRIG